MRQALVIDLDGTLVDVNTFREYIVFAAKEAVKSGRPEIAARMAMAVALRKARMISHNCMKRNILHASGRLMNAERLGRFVDILLKNVNLNVAQLVTQKHAEGWFVSLATAAPENYAEVFARNFPFDSICATPMPKGGEDWRENVGEVKRDRVVELLALNDARLSIFVTDHYDDLPLLALEKDTNNLVKPSCQTLEACRSLGIPFRIMT